MLLFHLVMKILDWSLLVLHVIFLSLHDFYMVVHPLGLFLLSYLFRGASRLPSYQREKCLKKTVPGKPLLYTANGSLASLWPGSVSVDWLIG